MEKDGFHPHTPYQKGTRKSRDQSDKTQGVKIERKSRTSSRLSEKQKSILRNWVKENRNWTTIDDLPNEIFVPLVAPAKDDIDERVAIQKEAIDFMKKVTKELNQKKKRESTELLTSTELLNHPLFEESTQWLDALAQNPKIIIPDEKHGRFWIWYGGRMIHESLPDGEEIDAYTVGGGKEESLTAKEAIASIEKHGLSGK